MKTHRVPEYIFRMFDQEATKPEGRKAAIEWIRTQHVEIGDTLEMPDPETGEVMLWVKSNSPTF